MFNFFLGGVIFVQIRKKKHEITVSKFIQFYPSFLIVKSLQMDRMGYRVENIITIVL